MFEPEGSRPVMTSTQGQVSGQSEMKRQGQCGLFSIFQISAKVRTLCLQTSTQDTKLERPVAPRRSPVPREQRV